jgi:protein KRI1
MAPSATASALLAERSTIKSKVTKRQLLDDSDAESSDAESAGDDAGFKVNEEYARRFEHNKKREEKQKCASGYSMTWR